MNDKKSIFISYCSIDDKNVQWVEKFVDNLERKTDFHVIFDKYDLKAGDDVNFFMEDSIFNSDFILVIATKTYKNKADNRNSNVGIETYMASARYNKLLKEKRNPHIIVILREEDSIPNYLEGKKYINFIDDNLYCQRFNELINSINGKSEISRPPKSEIDRGIFEFTKADEIVGLIAKNKKCIISEADVKHYFSDSRIKFSLWEVSNPCISHYLILNKKININQTIQSFVDLILEKEINIKNLIVIRSRERAKNVNTVDNILKDKNIKDINTTEITYKKFIWEYCIDNEFKNIVAPDIIEFYTNQDILVDNGEIYFSAVDYIYENFTKDDSCVPILIKGSGGLGKTSLCLSLANKLIKEKNDQFLTYFINSEDIFRNINSYNFSTPVNTLYDLYRIQSGITNPNTLDQKTFNLSLISGNIIIIIDGLDEICSMFKENFDFIAFIDSINEMYRQLENARIIMTTRNYDFLENFESDKNIIKQFELLGFKIDNCEKFLRKRFKSNLEIEAKVKNIIKKVKNSGFLLQDRVTPFFVDIVAETEETYSEDTEYSMPFNSTPYITLNEYIDLIIYSIINREIGRHNIIMSIKEIISYICLFALEFGKIWSKDYCYDMLKINGKKGTDFYKSLNVNPLFKTENNTITFKYDFLYSYFISIGIMEAIYNNHLDDSIIKNIAILELESQECKDIIKFCNNYKANFFKFSKSLITNLKEKLSDEDHLTNNKYKTSIENIISILAKICNDKQEFNELFHDIYDTKLSKNVTHIYINGDIPPIDFSNLYISNSIFKNYKNFLICNFSDTKFCLSEFIDCANDNINSTNILSAKFENNCILGNLSNILGQISGNEKMRYDNFLVELKKFFRSFYSNYKFKDNNIQHIYFSKTFKGLNNKGFQKLLSKYYIIISAEKEIDTFYCINHTFQNSVRKLINDNNIDKKMKEFIEYTFK